MNYTNESDPAEDPPETKPLLKPEIKALWVTALLSGEYKQGTDRLETVLEDGTSEFCCLGVLAKELKLERVPVVLATAANESAAYYGGNAYDLPYHIKDDIMAQGHFSSCRLTIDHKTNGFMVHNDENRSTFAQIAKAIQEQL